MDGGNRQKRKECGRHGLPMLEEKTKKAQAGREIQSGPAWGWCSVRVFGHGFDERGVAAAQLDALIGSDVLTDCERPLYVKTDLRS